MRSEVAKKEYKSTLPPTASTMPVNMVLDYDETILKVNVETAIRRIDVTMSIDRDSLGVLNWSCHVMTLLVPHVT